MPEREERETWILTSRFEEMETARRAYEQLRNVVFGRNIDASVYRVQLGGVPHVILLGEGALPEWLRKTYEEACAKGQSVEMPEDVKSTLRERRIAGKLPGAFWEANYRPGLGVPRRRRRAG
jgi:hypothetical protein